MTAFRLMLLVPLLGACGGKAVAEDFNDAATTSDTTTTTGDTNSTVTDTNTTLPDGAPFDFCKAAAERAAKCMTGAPDPMECAQQQRCFQTIMRPEDYSPLLTCLATRACDVKDDTCVANHAMKYITDPAVQSYVKTCNEKRTACGGGFSDDYCGYDHGLLKDDVRAKLMTCLSRSCAEVKDCFDVIYAAAGCGR